MTLVVPASSLLRRSVCRLAVPSPFLKAQTRPQQPFRRAVRHAHKESRICRASVSAAPAGAQSASAASASASPPSSSSSAVPEEDTNGKNLECLYALQTVDEETLERLARDPTLAESFRLLRSKVDVSEVTGPPRQSDTVAGGGSASSSSPSSSSSSSSSQIPDVQKLRTYAFVSAVPFVGFGFLDNSIMLIAGDFFDVFLGSFLGISTLAAAALGNTVGDISGIWLGGSIEAAARKIGLPDPNMSAAERATNSAVFAKTSGRVVGVCLGCCLGMFPLFWPANKRLWPARPHEEEGLHEQGGQTVSTNPGS
uniref:Transmembrane protein 65 n=1 Tax=Chromera velia CCMP2878 TaxID=1169474 RepID=A0A0G4G3C1_9ALVE|eukprot:Cvel_19953.t1-p1 / transcript=Cvel_19953.t1 / gene=Cvel_19953 / organism=Chromera_velia_CCMP2878 / gene_product=Transmembrane protein 65, putative / transcript_product=Transmembrane protein 65, putative / location=Cvel_scaffold1756:31977-34533(-) / protein_length=310 / sequence_SO=supercontig / SO=protein_coding / is_pseudo=false